MNEIQNKLEECRSEKRKVEETGYKLIIFWFVVGFILGALFF